MTGGEALGCNEEMQLYRGIAWHRVEVDMAQLWKRVRP